MARFSAGLRGPMLLRPGLQSSRGCVSSVSLSEVRVRLFQPHGQPRLSLWGRSARSYQPSGRVLGNRYLGGRPAHEEPAFINPWFPLISWPTTLQTSHKSIARGHSDTIFLRLCERAFGTSITSCET